jgi:hypothetical protein
MIIALIWFPKSPLGLDPSSLLSVIRPPELSMELVPKLIDYALKRMVRTFGSMKQA